jgi:hypothetical protein
MSPFMMGDGLLEMIYQGFSTALELTKLTKIIDIKNLHQ